MPQVAPEALVAFLGKTPILAPCNPQILGKIAPFVEQRAVPRGQVIMPPGVAATHLGFLFSGRASLKIQNAISGGLTKLEDLQPGQGFGEVGLLMTGMSPMSVTAEEDCHVLLVRREHFEQILNGVPGVAQAVAKLLAQRVVKAGLLTQAPSAAPSPSAMPQPSPVATGNLRRGEHRFFEISAFNLNAKTLELLPGKVIHQQRVLPLELRDKTLLVGMVNPTSEEARQEIKRVLPTVDPEFVAISIDDFNQTIVRYKLDLGGVGDKGASPGAKPTMVLTHSVERKKEADKGQVMMGDEVSQIVDRILIGGLERGASDIHIEPEPSGTRVRYRVQGSLVDSKEIIPLSFFSGIAARIKILAELDITEKRIPQDGRIATQAGKRELSFRVSTLATGRGEKVVMRILDPMDVMRPLEHIFLEPRMLQIVQRALASPHGAILVAGPTGSGKSSTLYSMLAYRKASRPDSNIVTVEDPVEFPIVGITQTPINVKVGLDYPTALRALMRQDPDVILVGELRDHVSTGIAVEAALTGHMVLSSIHGSTAAAVLQRLAHFEISPVLLSQALNVILVQRLAPRMCPSCVKEEEPAPAMIENLIANHLLEKGAGAVKLPRAVGCDNCEGKGRKGRVPVIEVLSLQDDMRAVLASGAPPSELLSKAVAGGQFYPFAQYAKLLMARKLLAAGDALNVVTG